jgi:hypothetical protein
VQDIARVWETLDGRRNMRPITKSGIPMLRPSEKEHTSPDGKTTSVAFTKALNATARMLRDGGVTPLREERVRASIRVLCVFARQEHMTPEHLLVEFKEMMTSSHALDRIPRDKREDVRSDMVTFAIDAYFTGVRIR